MHLLTSLPRSFVRRERRLTQQKISTQLWKRYRINAEIQPPIELSLYFEQAAPLTLEIGFGTGDSLFTQAQSNATQNYVGIEVYQTGTQKLLRRLAQLPLDNLKILEGDAVDLVSHYISSHTVDNIQILFPDPWPKRRHHKRRLIQPAFIKCLYRILKPNGKLYLATDWQDYAQHMLNSLEASALINSAGQYQFAFRPQMIPCTKFEKRAQGLGHRIFYLVFSKCQSSNYPLSA